MSKRKRQEAILSIIAKHQVATQEELVERLHRAGILTTQATVSRDIAELGLMRVAGPEGHYIKPEDGLGAASTAGRRCLERWRATTRSSSRSPSSPAPTAGSPSGWLCWARTSSPKTSTS